MMLVKEMYPCQKVPVVVLSRRCGKPCLYCDLYNKKFSDDEILANGKAEILKEIIKYNGAYFSAVTDCFLGENAEETHDLLESIWKLKEDFVPLLVTKYIIPDKTIDLIANNKHRVVVQISVPCLNENLVSILEPGAASIKDRLETIKKLTDKGVKVLAVVMPWFNIYENEFIDLPKALSDVGVRKIFLGTGILPPEQKEKILNTNNELLINAINKMTEIKIAITKTGYTPSTKDRIEMF